MENTGITIITPKSNYQDFPASIGIPFRSILFFSAEDELSHQVQENYDDLLVKFNELGFHFTIIRSDTDFSGIGQDGLLKIYHVLEYKYPLIKNACGSFSEWYFDKASFSSSKLKLFLSGYENSSKDWHSGFYLNVSDEYFYSNLAYGDSFTDYITSFVNFARSKQEEISKEWSGALFRPVNTGFLDEEPEPIDVDSEVKDKIELIERNLNELKESGDFYLIISLLQKYIVENKEDITEINELSLKISKDDYKITIPELNTEVKLNTLTKAIYFLFLAVGEEGINLKCIASYRNYLHRIYKAISNRTDLEQIGNSIYNLTSEGNNLIYMHLSRIKSAFCDIMDNHYAKEFYVDGKKNQNKSIPHMTCENSNIKDFYRFWGFPPGRVSDIDMDEFF